MTKVVPVILEQTFDMIQQRVKSVEQVAPLVQIDIADGKLVDGKTFTDIYLLNTLDTTSKLEIHLMVEDPPNYLRGKIRNADRICAQVEPTDKIADFIWKAKEMDYTIGLSVSPETTLSTLETFVDHIDFVQFMTTHPGAQGRSICPEVIDKIKLFRKKYPRIPIQVDGGINDTSLKHFEGVGINTFVIGSAIFNTENPSESYLHFVDSIKDTDAYVSPLTTIMERKINRVAFFGGAAWKKDDPPYQDAYNTAKLLAEKGYEIVNGGGPGVMEASTLGGKDGGGKTLAVTYHPNKIKRHYEGVAKSNTFDEEIITLSYFDRTKVMLENTDVHIVFNGSLGTLSEFAMTWILSWIHEPNNKPIIVYGDFWTEFVEWMKKRMYLKDGEERLLKCCNSPQEVLEYIVNLG